MKGIMWRANPPVEGVPESPAVWFENEVPESPPQIVSVEGFVVTWDEEDEDDRPHSR